MGTPVVNALSKQRAMLENVQATESAIILELGCGTGAFTKAIEKILPSDNCYLGIEINPEFVGTLKIRFPDLKIVCGNADSAVQIHRKSGLGKIDYIISALPFGSLPMTARTSILAEIDRFMRRGCVFRTIQYASSMPFPPARVFRREMEMRYGKTEFSKLIWRNVPPVYILAWRT